MPSLDALFDRLRQSAFRRRFRLGLKEQAYLRDKGLPLVLRHAEDLIASRLAAALPARDGKQTPFRGHPVFIAQHATACCCRGCLAEWHGIAQGQALTAEQRAYILKVLAHWLSQEAAKLPPETLPAASSGLDASASHELGHGHAAHKHADTEMASKPAPKRKPTRKPKENADSHLGQLPIVFPEDAK